MPSDLTLNDSQKLKLLRLGVVIDLSVVHNNDFRQYINLDEVFILTLLNAIFIDYFNARDSWQIIEPRQGFIAIALCVYVYVCASVCVSVC